MESVLSWAGSLLAAVLIALAPVLRQLAMSLAAEAAQRAALLVQQRIGEGATRVAGEIAARVLADPDLRSATGEMLDAGAEALRQTYAGSVTKNGITTDVLRRMVAGELGKLRVGIGA